MFPFEMEVYVNVVGNAYKRYPFVHAVILAIENHRTMNIARTRALTRDSQGQLLWVRHSSNCEIPIYLKGVWSTRHNFSRFEGDIRILFDSEEVFALQLAILHATSGIDTGGVDSYFQLSRCFIRGLER